MSFRAAACSLLAAPILVAGCKPAVDDDNGTPAFAFMITGAAMSARLQNVYVTVSNAGQSGLTVTVNGTALNETSTGQYFGTLPATVPTGGAIQLVVTDGLHTATGNSTVPDTPVITAATIATQGGPVAVTWTSATSPDSFTVTLNYHLPDGSAAAVLRRLAGSARQVSLPQSEILAGGTVFSVGLQGQMVGTFTGAAAAGSNMGLRASAPEYPFTVP